MTQKQRGLFIVIEGLDKAGKSTQCERLAENIRKMGNTVQSMRFPGSRIYKRYVQETIEGLRPRVQIERRQLAR